MIHRTLALTKFKKLKRRLGLPRDRDVVGILETMWLLTQREAPHGDLGKLDDETLAIELEWDEEPEVLITALVETGWLERHSLHRLIVHDWKDHAPRYVHSVVKRSGRPFVESEDNTLANTVANTLANTSADIEANTRARPLPNLTKPNPPPPTPSATTTTDSPAPGWEEVEEDLVSAGVGTARKTAAKLRGDGWLPQAVLAFIGHYRAHPGAWDAGALAHVLAESPVNIAAKDAVWPKPREPDARAQKAMKALAELRDGAADRGITMSEAQFLEAARRQLTKGGFADVIDEAIWRYAARRKSRRVPASTS